MNVRMYGIKNCDTVRKARRWLQENNIAFEFQDIRSEPLDQDTWSNIIQHTDNHLLINTRGTTWRQLTDAEKDISTPSKIQALLSANPTIMKRPLLVNNSQYHIGFKPDTYSEIFS